MTVQPIAALNGTDARRRAREDQVARRQLEQAGQVGDRLVDLPDQLAEVAGLTSLAVDVEPDGTQARVADPRRGHQGRKRPRSVERLCNVPGTPCLLGHGLQVAPGHVEADAVAPDVVEGALDGDVASALAQ